MLYTNLCYNYEDVAGAWTKEEDDAVTVRLRKVHEKIAKTGKLGPVVRLECRPLLQARRFRNVDLTPSVPEGVVEIDPPHLVRLTLQSQRAPRHPRLPITNHNGR